MSMNQEVEALRKVPMLKAVDAAKLKLLAFMSERMTFRPGEALCVQGETGDRAFVIMEGSADVLVDTPDGPKRVASVKESDIVGEISILCNVPRTASVVATTDLSALTVSADSFVKLMHEFPNMAMDVMQVLATRLERTTRDLAEVRMQLEKAD